MIDTEDIIRLKTSIVRKKILGIYFLLYNERIVYVGYTRDILQRIDTHKKGRKAYFNNIFYIEYKDSKSAKIDETKYIKRLTPKYNIKDNPIAEKESSFIIDKMKKSGHYFHNEVLNYDDVSKELKKLGIKPQLKRIT